MLLVGCLEQPKIQIYQKLSLPNCRYIGGTFNHMTETFQAVNSQMSSYFRINNERVNNLAAAIRDEHQTLSQMHRYFVDQLGSMTVTSTIQTKLLMKVTNYISLQSDMLPLRQAL